MRTIMSTPNTIDVKSVKDEMGIIVMDKAETEVLGFIIQDGNLRWHYFTTNEVTRNNIVAKMVNNDLASVLREIERYYSWDVVIKTII